MKIKQLPEKPHFLVSRTDSIGDVVLTLPICFWLKEQFPGCKVSFLAQHYTLPIVKSCAAVDEVVDFSALESVPLASRPQELKRLHVDVFLHVFPRKEIAALAKKAGIPHRVGTSHRSFHLLTCNHRVSFSRKRSNLHEAQLNFELLRPLGLTTIPLVEEIVRKYIQLKVPKVALTEDLERWLSDGTAPIVLHPKSKGSAVEWPLENYIMLCKLLIEDGKRVVFTGTAAEGKHVQHLIPANVGVYDSLGKLSLEQLMVLVSRASGMVACSTGPLHIAASLGVQTLGLYVPRRPLHAGRWAALGKNVRILERSLKCTSCKQSSLCECIRSITPEQVVNNFRG